MTIIINKNNETHNLNKNNETQKKEKAAAFVVVTTHSHTSSSLSNEVSNIQFFFKSLKDTTLCRS